MNKKLFMRWKALVLTMVFLCVSMIGTANMKVSADNGVMRDIVAMDLTKEMRVGWNLGNTMDSDGGETAWGNPKTTKAMIDMIKDAGFNTVRIPVSWAGHVGSAPDYKIDETWMSRVEEIVNYVLDNDMYAILNLHHEDKWLIPTYANEEKSKAQLVKMWEQIGDRFKNYNDYLIFETMNEPRVVGATEEWSGGTAENRAVINSFNLAAVNTIRASGGNNTKRFIMIPTHAACALTAAVNDLVIPNNDSRVMVSIHSYSPYYFSMVPAETASWGTAAEKNALSSELDALYNKFIKNGRAVVIGEFGTIDKNNINARVIHAEYYAKEARARGIPVIWWDNGYYGPGKDNSYILLNRSKLTWYYPEIANALVRGSGISITPYPTHIPMTPTNTPTPTPVKPGTEKYEAESGKLTGTTIEKSTAGFSGTGYVTSFDEAGDTAEITINKAAAGEYELTVGYAGIYGTKNNDVYVNGTLLGSPFFPETTGFSEVYAGKVKLNQGANSIKIVRNWGWFLLDYISLAPVSGSTIPTSTNTPTATNTPTPTTQESIVDIYGDVSGDGIVDSADYTYMRRYLLGMIKVFPASNGKKMADVNLDDTVDSADYTYLRKYLLKIINTLPVGSTNTTPTVTPTLTATPTPDITGEAGILYNGRFDFSDSKGPKCAWSGSNVELNFYGSKVSATIKSTGENWFQAIIDGKAYTPFVVNSTTSTVNLASDIALGNHKLVLWKRTEVNQGEAQFLGFDFGQGKLLASPNQLERKIEFIGDSITCAYGNEGTSKEQSFTAKNENSYLSYAAITARSLNASANLISWSGIGISQNYGGQSGPLMLDRYPYALPYSNVKWDFKKYVPQVVVINLGTNDYSTSTADKTKFITNYNTLVSQVRSNYPNSHIFCTIGPMLWGSGLEACRTNVNEVISGFKAKGDSKVYLLEYPQQSESNGYGEDWHPSLKTHQLMADQLTEAIKSKLGW